MTLEHGTERAFTGKTVNGYTHDNKQRGTYVCALGGLPLFSSVRSLPTGDVCVHVCACVCVCVCVLEKTKRIARVCV